MAMCQQSNDNYYKYLAYILTTAKLIDINIVLHSFRDNHYFLFYNVSSWLAQRTYEQFCRVSFILKASGNIFNDYIGRKLFSGKKEFRLYRGNQTNEWEMSVYVYELKRWIKTSWEDRADKRTVHGPRGPRKSRSPSKFERSCLSLSPLQNVA